MSLLIIHQCYTHSSAVTSELMFEQYSVPSLAYCVDSVMSFYHNQTPQTSPFVSDGIVVSFNTASTSVIPILKGKGIMSHSKRFESILWILVPFRLLCMLPGYLGAGHKPPSTSSN